MKKYKCKYCKIREFKNKGGLIQHQNMCKQVNNLNIYNEIKELYKNGLSIHKLLKKGYKGAHINFAIKDIRRTAKEALTLSFKLYPRKLSKKTKNKISKSMIRMMKNNPNHPWSKKEESYPEKLIRKWLTKNLSSKHKIIQEYRPKDFNRNFRMDFAFLNEKIDLEVNGHYHYNKNGKLKSYYVKRQKYIESKGWKVLNIHAYDIVYDFEKVKEILVEYIELGNECIVNNIKTQKQILDEKFKINKTLIKKMFKNNFSTDYICEKLDIKSSQLQRFLKKNNLKRELLRSNKNRKKIIESKKEKKERFKDIKSIDVTKFGWIAKLSRLWNVSHTQVRRYIKREFPDILNISFQKNI